MSKYEQIKIYFQPHFCLVFLKKRQKCVIHSKGKQCKFEELVCKIIHLHPKSAENDQVYQETSTLECYVKNTE